LVLGFGLILAGWDVEQEGFMIPYYIYLILVGWAERNGGGGRGVGVWFAAAGFGLIAG
jgi:hypothetical protein